MRKQWERKEVQWANTEQTSCTEGCWRFNTLHWLLVNDCLLSTRCKGKAVRMGVTLTWHIVSICKKLIESVYSVALYSISYVSATFV